MLFRIGDIFIYSTVFESFSVLGRSVFLCTSEMTLKEYDFIVDNERIIFNAHLKLTCIDVHLAWTRQYGAGLIRR